MLIEKQTSKRIKSMVNDNGGEYTSSQFTSFVKDHGIKMLLTAPYTPQQNPVAEIGNRTTTEKARDLLKQAGLPNTFWAEAVATSVYLENITPVASRNFLTPHELWYGQPPSYDHLRVFGCLAYVHVGRDRRQGKFSDTAKRGIFVGYQEGHHNYRVWLLDEKRIVYSHDVVFNEACFPLKGSHVPFLDSNEDDYPVDDPNLVSELTPPENITQSSSESLSHSTLDEAMDSLNVVEPSSVTPGSLVPLGIVKGDQLEDSSNFNELDSSSLQGPRVDRAPDPLLFNSTPLASSIPVARHDISSSIDTANILPSRSRRRAFAAATVLPDNSHLADPATYSQALSRPDSDEWIASMNKELNALEAMNVWEEVTLPPGEHALGTTWVYKRKTGPSGELLKYKSRLCAQGFSQIKGVDYSETYVPTGRLSTLRTALGISATEDLEIVQMDAVGAFLNGIPDEVLYIKIPKGYVCKGSGDNLVLCLNKSLYRLKQSPRCWYRQLSNFFTSINFRPSKADPCFFLSKDTSWKCGVFIHVDDLCIMGLNTDKLKLLISQRFVMEDIGPCTFFLGMRIVRNRKEKTITLYQDKYIKSILSERGMEDCRPSSTPMIPNSHLLPASESEIAEFKNSGDNYQRAVGQLNYLVLCTRPDLAFVASQLAQFLDKPGPQHWAAFKRVLRYLKHTTDMGLQLGGAPVTLSIYCDSDHAGCPFSRRSVTGYCAFIAGGCVSWRARKQPTVATSTTEAEYRAAYEAAQEVIWLRQFLMDMNYDVSKPITLLCDNQGALALSKNPLYQSRSKHFDILYHWIREKVNDDSIAPTYIVTSLMLADFLTKAVHLPKHNFCCKGLGLSPPTQRGGS